MKLLEATLASTPIARPVPTADAPQGLGLDRGYDYDAIRELAGDQRVEPHIRTRGEEIADKVRDPTWRLAAAALGRRGRALVAETATARSSSAGQRRTRTTSPYSSSPAG